MSKIFAGLAAAAALAALSGAAPAAELVAAPAVLKPVKALTFDVGAKRAVTYYQQVGGNCNLTLVMSERPDDAGVVAAPAVRVAVPVLGGKTARVDTAEGKALEFACAAGAGEMSVKAVEQVAWQRGPSKG